MQICYISVECVDTSLSNNVGIAHWPERLKKWITAVTGHRVIVGEAEMRHAQEHFLLPDLIYLELLEQVLRDPTKVFVDNKMNPHVYHLFYRLENGRYL